ncbi:unnamed protein product [Dibothriocephalus latus]|uniref:Tr-type G domain-containing protein n=1 Tax=Dibothriocephalus latus TaxID=60516 RepID=A0A3P7NXR6_DIBLA|nr:unnamed protein product [Dibothriocephalus latus]
MTVLLRFFDFTYLQLRLRIGLRIAAEPSFLHALESVVDMILNVNVGVLGHVDSGKTSLCKALSTVASTAAFDKNPQSQKRGITLDLGFSSFTVKTNIPPQLSSPESPVDALQITLVDCPGHASLIRTIICGSHIIDMMLLVVDVNKGFQTQTAECLIIGELTCKVLLVVLNKVDLLEPSTREEKIAKVRLTHTITLTASLSSDEKSDIQDPGQYSFR